MARASSPRMVAVPDAEVLPEADRLEGFPHPRETEVLFGHGPAEKQLAEAFSGGRMHHGWLFAGPPGIGKATLAYRFARFVLAEAGERDMFGDSLSVGAETVASRQVLSQSHPGLLVIRRPYDPKGKRFVSSIPVDEVRRVRGFLSHRGADDAWRVVIVDSADELNVNAANAILKSLEEPPERTVFLLISSQPGRLLNTIRSRCRRLELSVPGVADQLAAVRQAIATVEDDMPEDGQLEKLVGLSGGSIRRALSLKGLGGLELAQRVDELFADLPRLRWGKIHALAEELAPQAADERFEVFFGFLMERLAGLIKSRAGVSGRLDQRRADLAQRLIGEGQLASWAGLWETLARLKSDAAALNLDRKALILDVAGRLEAAASASR